MTDDENYNFDDFDEDDDFDEEDEFHNNLMKWNRTAFEKFINSFHMNVDKYEAMQLDLDIIEEYYPGSKSLTDNELLKRKYYPGEHSFQLAVAIKRMLEETGKGVVIDGDDGWHFGVGSSL